MEPNRSERRAGGEATAEQARGRDDMGKTERLQGLNWVLGALIVAMAISLVLGLMTRGGGAIDPSGLLTGDGAAPLIGIAPASIDQTLVDQAQATEPLATQLATLVNQSRLGANFVWTLVAGFLVMFMQLGFALVETGFCRKKNALEVMAMNFVVYILGMFGYFLIGFGLQFGGLGSIGVPNLGGLSALDHFITIGDWRILGWKGFGLAGSYDVGIAVMFLFQMVFMDTAATIPTGAMAERWRWPAFCVYALFISTIIYPIYGMWAWGGGWLSQLGNIGLGAGYADFAGSGVVHAVGGWTALAGVMVLGPRLGKFNRDGSANVIPGHNIVMALTGVLILAFGWFGFNPGSTLGAVGNGNLRIGLVAVATMLASATGGIVAMLYMWWTTGKPDVAMTANGVLGGLVAITAPSGFVSPLNACIIGAIAGVLIPVSVSTLESVFKIDDPVGAISVHGVGGLWGQLAVGLFADGTMNYGGWTVSGLFYGNPGQLGAQIVGAAACFIWAFGVGYIFFRVLNATMGIRVPAAEEISGLDLPEMGAPAYWDGDEPVQGAWPAPAMPVGAASGAA
jgi:Amt family ammonium transporter